jgi:hypothetical protein
MLRFSNRGSFASCTLNFSTSVFQYLSPQKKESFNKDFCHMPYQNYINKDHNKSICAAQQAGKFKENNKKK